MTSVSTNDGRRAAACRRDLTPAVQQNQVLYPNGRGGTFQGTCDTATRPGDWPIRAGSARSARLAWSYARSADFEAAAGLAGREPGQQGAQQALLVFAEGAEQLGFGTVIRRHVGTDPLPADAWANAVTGARTPEADRSERQRAGIAGADAVLLAVPLYNFGVSQHIKTWIDLVIAAPRDSSGAEPLLAGKPTVLVTVRGAYGAGTPREGWDHSTGYLRRILADVWGAELTVEGQDIAERALRSLDLRGAHLLAQSGLGRLRRAVRSDRHQGHPP
ncbi:MAG: NAD(P)H-dependent oxidoreductase [Streptosporangiaceae bacterium]|jgi:FMN-dependent NADH-azoreductase